MSRNFLHDNDGRFTGITPGCAIGWDPEGSYISIFPPPLTNDGSAYRWRGDDKKLTPFISSHSDFWQFAEILAMSHGLRIEVESPRFIRFARLSGS